MIFEKSKSKTSQKDVTFKELSIGDCYVSSSEYNSVNTLDSDHIYYQMKVSENSSFKLNPLKGETSGLLRSVASDELVIAISITVSDVSLK